MKHLLIALIATMTLGVACKKSNDVADSKPDLKAEKIQNNPTDESIGNGDHHDPNSLSCNCNMCRPQQNPPR